MNKIIVYSIIFFSIAGFIFGCKHELPDPIPGGGGTGGGTGGGGTGGGGTTIICSPDTAYFQQQVLPIFISNCAVSGCHDAITRQDGVNLTNYNSIMTTGDVRPFNPGNSEVWEKITDPDPSDRMPPPPRNPLTQAQKDIIFKWIMQGAKNNSCQPTACDSSNFTFSGSIRTIINNKCLGCHSSTAAQGNINFSTYTGVKAKVDDGRLWGAINHFPGFSPMPKNGNKLSDCEITLFRKWIATGAPNN